MVDVERNLGNCVSTASRIPKERGAVCTVRRGLTVLVCRPRLMKGMSGGL